MISKFMFEISPESSGIFCNISIKVSGECGILFNGIIVGESKDSGGNYGILVVSAGIKSWSSKTSGLNG